MTRAAIENEAMLAPIEWTLRRVIWRARAAMVLRGTLATLAAAAGGILLAIGIAAQWMVIEAWQHYALTGLWVAAAAAAAVVTLVRPLARSFTLAGIARVIEQRHPELHERISSTVELLGSPDAPEIRGSDALIGALAEQAVGDIRTVQPRREISFRRARPFIIAFAVGAGAIAVLAAMFPKFVGPLLARTVAPHLNVSPYDHWIRVLPGEKVLPAGERLEITARVTGTRAEKVETATFYFARDGAGEQTVDVAAVRAGLFTYTTPPLDTTVRYRVRAGRGLSRYYTATVVPRPAVRGVEVGYTYPAYMSRPPDKPLAGRGRIAGPVGAVATVRVDLNKPIQQAELLINGTPAALTGAGAAAYTFSHQLTKASNGTWRIVLTDAHQFTGDLEREIRVRPDAAPHVRILSPDQDALRLRPTDRVPLSLIHI